MLNFPMPKNPSRRNFLRTAPLAAAATLALTENLRASTLTNGEAPTPEPIQLLPAEKLAASVKALHAKPGNDNLYLNKALPFIVLMTVEEKKAAKEFEYHEGRDHVFQILEGTTTYELGGTPQNPRSTKPGEWLAPTSTGATTHILNKGDMLIIPRGIPHKRTTESSVTFTLISTEGTLKP